MTEAHARALAYLDANVFIDFAEGIPSTLKPANGTISHGIKP